MLGTKLKNEHIMFTMHQVKIDPCSRSCIKVILKCTFMIGWTELKKTNQTSWRILPELKPVLHTRNIYTRLKPCSLPTYKCGLLACTEKVSFLYCCFPCTFRVKNIRAIKTKGQRKPSCVPSSCCPGRMFIRRQVSYFFLKCLNFLDVTFQTEPRPPAVGYYYDFLGADQLTTNILF